MAQQRSRHPGFDSRRGSKKQVSRRLRFLILCEGTKTEANYLKAILNEQENLTPGSCLIDTKDCKIQGTGQGTTALVAYAKKFVRSTQLSYDRVWLVFDKDDFTDFNQAIHEAEAAGYNVAWSNEAFELWFLLHFRNQTTHLGRVDLIKALEKEIRKHDKSFSYSKGTSDMLSLLERHGDRVKACKFASMLRQQGTYAPASYDRCNPCTCVDLLLAELTDKDRQQELLSH